MSQTGGETEGGGPDGSQEPRRQRARRHARRIGLYAWATLFVVVLIAIVVLAVQNSSRVKVGWIFGHSRISLDFLVLFAAILGWILGIATSILFRRRTRLHLP